MSVVALCPDCGVAPGNNHEEGCDVAHCVTCGAQALMHEHEDLPVWGHIWTGEWPGTEEIAEGLAADYNDLFMKSSLGEGSLVWDGQRWQKP